MNREEMQNLISGMSIDSIIKEYEESASICTRMLFVSAFLDYLNLEYRFDLQKTTNIETGEEEFSEEARDFYNFFKQVKLVEAKAEVLHLLSLPMVSPIDDYNTTLNFDIVIPGPMAQISQNIVVGITSQKKSQKWTPNIDNNVVNFKELVRKKSFPIHEEIYKRLWMHVFNKNSDTLRWNKENPFSEIIFASDAKIKLAMLAKSITQIKNAPVEELAYEINEEIQNESYDNIRSRKPKKLSYENKFSLEVYMKELQDFIPYLDEKIDELSEVFANYSSKAFIRFISGEVLHRNKR